MSPSKLIAAASVLCLAAGSPADAKDRDGFLEPAENPLLGSWLLVGELKNPNLPIGCPNLRITFGQEPRTYMSYKPGQIAISQTGIVYTIIDHNHIMIDELAKCTYERGPPNGTTPLIQSIEAPAAPPPPPPPAAAAVNDGSHPMTYGEAIEGIRRLNEKQK